VKRASRRTPAAQPVSVDTLRSFIQATTDEHQRAWHAELTGDTPFWIHLLGLHLRLVELERLEEGVGELL
jgi:hypothetical protein